MKFIARLMLVVALVLMAGPLAAAADRVVKGTVLDNQDEPLVGVSVVVAGQNAASPPTSTVISASKFPQAQ